MSRPPPNLNGHPRNATAPSSSSPSLASGDNGFLPRLATPQMSSSSRPQSSGAPAAPLSRAERFEDEKRRIVESCFSKLDPSGQLAESYITHIRIVEDAAHPSSPPPPESPEANKKTRMIIVAVRSTGRVRMHKARENNNGSFSIGKTWNMEELSAIDVFNGPAPLQPSEKEAQQRQWAGDIGFTVTLTKPYYWQAGTPKEKDFFIASAVKIYRKYTKGQVPELRGLEEREKNAILGNGPAGGPQQQQQQQQQQPPPPQPPFARRDDSQEGSRYRQSPGPPPSAGEGRPPRSRRPSDSPARFAATQTAAGGLAPAGGGGPRPSMSSDQMRQNSRDGRSPALRPGTSPARQPAAGHRSPALRPGSPVRPFTPPTQRDAQPPDATSEARKPASSATTSGANLFNTARQRFLDYQAPSSSTLQSDQGSATASPELAAATLAGDRPSNGVVGASVVDTRPRDSSPVAAPTTEPDLPGPRTPERSQNRVRASPKPSTNDAAALRSATASQARLPAADTVEREPTLPATQDPSLEVKPLHIQNKPSAQSPVSGAQFRPSADSTPAETPEDERDEAALYRPGLGPMIKKKTVADRFKKAATAATAFKPRPGGAGDRILAAKAERDGDPDGINGVVPRPGSRRGQKQEDTAPIPVEESMVSEPQQEPPAVHVSSPQTPLQPEQPPPKSIRRSVELVESVAHLQPAQPEPAQAKTAEEDPPEPQELRQDPGKIKHRTAQQEKYLVALGIDLSLLETKGLEFEITLSDFGWNNQILRPKQLAALEHDIRREQGRMEAGSWLSQSDATREERVTQVEALLDAAIAECDELDGLLTLYSVELSTLNDDISFIETQSQGLQVQSANQKLLQSELQRLVDTMSLDRRVLDPIRFGDLSDPQGLEDVERSLVRLYQAMLVMDPAMKAKSGALVDNEAASMSALRDKKASYDRETQDFCKRVTNFLDQRFTSSMNVARTRALRAPKAGGLAKLQPDAFNEVRSELWMYTPVILFARELHPPAWQTLLRMYHTRAGLLYAGAFKENVSNWKRAARTSTGEEAELLFTTQEKEEPSGGSITSTARKLTVKRSQTLARTFRGASFGEKHAPAENKQPGALMRAQVFAGAMDEMAPFMSREQNFFMDFFHAHSLEPGDFVEAVQQTPPAQRRVPNLLDRKPTDPDRHAAQLVNTTMGDIFNPFGKELEALLHWVIADDPLQGVGVMASLGRHAFYLQGSSQEYLLQMVRELSDKLQTRFTRFIEEQIRAIEDTKVKIKKRKGVIAFMHRFPHFSAAVENVLVTVGQRDYDTSAACMHDVRARVDDAYERINRAMFDSLKVIAKESPVASGAPPPAPPPPPPPTSSLPFHRQAIAAAAAAAVSSSSSGEDPDDKEMLNYHILLIENMNHYIEEVDDGQRSGVLADWKLRAQRERADALEAYVARVIRRPLGKLLDFLESAESLLSTHRSPAAVSSRPSYSRKAFRSVLAAHDAKELRRGVDALRRRIEKHFGDADEEALARALVVHVCAECERAFEQVAERVEALVRDVFPPVEGEKSVEPDWGRADVQAAFRR